MENLIQKIVIKLKTTFSLTNNAHEVEKTIKEEVFAIIRGGQVIEVSQMFTENNLKSYQFALKWSLNGRSYFYYQFNAEY